MPFRYTFSDTPPCAVVTFYDSVVNGELGDAVRTVYTDPAWLGGDAIWDFSAVGNRVVLLPEDIAHLTASADSVGAAEAPGHTVIVVTGQDAEMVARLYRHLRRGATRRFSIVRTREEADALLAGADADSRRT